MPKDDATTYGFNRTDAEQILQGIDGRAIAFQEWQPTKAGGGGSDIYAFKITSTRTGSNPATWTANILDPTDQSTVLFTGKTLYGNYVMFDDLTTNDNGICGKYGAAYIIINAPC